MTEQRSPIVLDLDGVVLQTNFVKHSAMLSLFEVDDDQKTEISRYILSNGGVRRDLKISHVLRTILKNSEPEHVLPNYLEAYSAKLEQVLLAAPLVPGVKEFVRNSGYTFYVSSSAPESEIDLQLRSRGLLRFFEAVFGALPSRRRCPTFAQSGHHCHPCSLATRSETWRLQRQRTRHSSR